MKLLTGGLMEMVGKMLLRLRQVGEAYVLHFPKTRFKSKNGMSDDSKCILCRVVSKCFNALVSVIDSMELASA